MTQTLAYRERSAHPLTLPCLRSTMGNVLTIRNQQRTLSDMATPPQETDLLWPDPKKGPWWIHVWWRVQHGVPTPVGFSLRSWITRDESRPSGWHNSLPLDVEDAELPHVDGRLIRDLPMGALIDAARTQLHERLRHDVDTEGWPAAWIENLSRWRESVSEDLAALDSGRRGRDLGNAHYREVAEVYAAAVQAGKPPTAAVAAHFTVEKSSAAKKVSRARQRGFLPPTTKGRVGPLSKEL